MRTLGYDTFKEEMGYQRMQRCINANDDIVVVIGGNEGSGKSIFGLALCDIDPTFTGKQIYYFWKDYLRAIQHTIRATVKSYNKDDLTKFNIAGLKEEELNDESGEALTPGSCLLYDESGTQMFNRSAMTAQNVAQVKMFITNRFLRLIHILCVPKVRSLDKYIREERIRFLFWIHKENETDMRTHTRYCYVWSRQSFNAMTKMPRWWMMFDNQHNIEALNPDFKMKLPDFLNDKYIKNEVVEEYNIKKSLFNLKQANEMSNEDVDGKPAKAKVNYEELRVKSGESLWDWVKRTNKPPGSYKTYAKQDYVA